MNTTITYSVPGISCQHCVAAITSEVTGLAGVRGVEVSIEDKTVAVVGDVDPAAIGAAIEEAGYEVASGPVVTGG